jgi:hypothetical protein
VSTVLVDNTGLSAVALSATTVTIGSFAVGSGASRCIYLVVSQWKATDLQPTAAFDPTGVNQAFAVHDSVTIAESPGTRRITLFKLVNASNITANIVVTWGSACDEVVVGADSWTNVDQTTPFSAAVKASSGGSTPSSISVPNAVGDVVHSAISADAGSGVSIVSNQTQRWRAIASGGTTEGAGQSADGTGSNITMTFSGIQGGQIWTHIGVAIQQASGGAAAPTQAPLLPTMAIAPHKGRIGPLAMVMRALRPPQQTTPSATTAIGTGAALSPSTAVGSGSVAAAGGGAAPSQSTAYAVGNAIVGATGNTRSDSTEATQSTAVASGSGAAPSNSAAAAAASSRAAGNGRADSNSTDTGSGASGAAGTGNTLGVSVAPGSSSSVVSAIGTGASLAQSTAQASGSATSAGSGQASSPSAARAAGASTVSATGSTSSVSAARGAGAVVASSVGTALSIASGLTAAIARALGTGFSLALSFLQGSSRDLDPTHHLDEPLSIEFDSLESAIDFTSLATTIDFDAIETVLVFLDGGTDVLELTILKGELTPIAMTLQGADPVTGALVKYDVSAASSVKLNAGRPGGTLVINAKDLVKTDAVNGRVTYNPASPETDVAGKYDALVVATFPGSPGVVRKFPGKLTIKDAIA